MKKKMTVNPVRPQVTAVCGVTFTQTDGWFGHVRRDLRMDILYPETPRNPDSVALRYPGVLWICGGAWLDMDRSAHLAYLASLARCGFTVASAEYRTSNLAPWPAALEDIRAALRWLRRESARYNLDPSRIGVMGESAGGHLASMAALTADPASPDAEPVRAACVWYPPSDFSAFLRADSRTASVSPELLLLGDMPGGTEEAARHASPVFAVSSGAPPFLILHGNADTVVPFGQGLALHDALEQAGADVTLVEIGDAGHADLRFFQDSVWEEIAAFFSRVLGGPVPCGKPGGTGKRTVSG